MLDTTKESTQAVQLDFNEEWIVAWMKTSKTMRLTSCQIWGAEVVDPVNYFGRPLYNNLLELAVHTLLKFSLEGQDETVRFASRGGVAAVRSLLGDPVKNKSLAEVKELIASVSTSLERQRDLEAASMVLLRAVLRGLTHWDEAVKSVKEDVSELGSYIEAQILRQEIGQVGQKEHPEGSKKMSL